MNWEEVRKTYPDKYVKIKILESHMKGNKKYIDDMAIIKIINDSKEATSSLVHSGKGTIVYHTCNENIFIEVKTIRAY